MKSTTDTELHTDGSTCIFGVGVVHSNDALVFGLPPLLLGIISALLNLMQIFVCDITGDIFAGEA